MRRGFTLLELLVGLSIVTILGTVVFAVSADVRENAQTIGCTARLRALSQAVLAYSVDHQGYFPRSGHSGSSWAAAVAPYLGERELANPLDYRGLAAFSCPVQEADGTSETTWGYGLNVFFELSSQMRYTPAGLPILGSRDTYTGAPATWNRPSDVPHPERTILLAENPHAVADHFMAHQWRVQGAVYSAVAHDRHGGRANYAFVDGRVQTMKAGDTFDPATDTNLWNPSLAR
ncbi:prepilin-type N-terminal cleavage/methylation domain-containing protein [Ruficoccus amylovorans]|uniref:Prepilin-type N-terminal cleavage/methylation domain-containing protein n=1 Tax=Ruficoccus amylovorans TaxID=1804625 RepID=A0A842HFQ2_9BACT|nr:prepilin-type N-terminal cleavage/methylation domain-containing protein [Ruficoccus amylovorans]MBC2595232.1 prepilin-type N-terminal cleavage/methylation domain-containing protein [Ruficoccus amylovorans]